MRKRSRKWSRTFLATALLLALPGAAFAQSQSGNLYGTVTDTSGGILPGVMVTVEIAGGGVERLQVTGETGEFRFIGLSPATYDLKAMLDGFSTVEYPGIQISVNRNTTLVVELAPAVQETITVTSEIGGSGRGAGKAIWLVTSSCPFDAAMSVGFLPATRRVVSIPCSRSRMLMSSPSQLAT